MDGFRGVCLRYGMNIRLLGLLGGVVGLFMLLPLAYAHFQGELVRPYLEAMAIAFGIAALGWIATPGARADLTPRDAFFITGIGWFYGSFIGGLPYLLDGHLDWVGAFFESASGFTTTGSSLLTDIESWPRGMLLWRGLTHFLGGMGIIMMAVAILPFLGVGGMQLMRAEVPGPTKDKLVPRMIATAQLLWVIYVGLVVACAVAYWSAGMSGYEAVVHAFATLATGGFSTRNASMGAFSAAAQWWAILFMFLGGVNFTLHYRFLFLRDPGIFRDAEFRWYVVIILTATLCIAPYLLVVEGAPLERSVRDALFQVIAIQTTTGFVSVDWEQWPPVLQLLLGGLMVIGACAGSTGGGGKVIRGMVIFSLVPVAIKRLLKPKAVVIPRVAGHPLDNEVLDGTVSLLIIAMTTIIFSGVVLNLMGMDLLSAMGASLTCFANVGPGFNTVGAVDNFAHVPPAGQLLLAVEMVMGRLEIFTIIVLLSPRFWRE